MKNIDVREYLKKSGVYQWQVSEAMGIHEVAFSRKMRHEMSDEEKKRIYDVIDSLKQKNL